MIGTCDNKQLHGAIRWQIPFRDSNDHSHKSLRRLRRVGYGSLPDQGGDVIGGDIEPVGDDRRHVPGAEARLRPSESMVGEHVVAA